MELTLALGVIAASLSYFPAASAHSWNEQISLVDPSGNFTANGYTRGYVARTDPGYTGNSMMWLLPSADSKRSRIDPTDFICHTSQRTKTQSANYPRLQVTPGSTIALKYLENGHVTKPLTQKGKQPSAGSVFVFGTTQPKDDAKITDVLQWTADGQGGDKSGQLLVAQNFDDGRCHQINNFPLSVQRQAQWPDYKPGQTSGNNELWCQTVINLPQNIPIGQGAYTLYWVWDWRTVSAQQVSSLSDGQVVDPSLPDGKDEFYTSCSDYDVVAQPPAPAPNTNTLAQQDPMPSIQPRAASMTASIASPGAEPSPNYGAPGGGQSAPSPSSALTPSAAPASSTPPTSAPISAPTSTPISAPTSTPSSAPASSPATSAARTLATPAPAPATVSPLGLEAFKPAPNAQAATPALSPSTMISNSPAPAGPTSIMTAITVPVNAPVYMISDGSLVPVHKRAEPTPTTLASVVRRWSEGYSVEERAHLAHKKREESSGHYHAFGRRVNGTSHEHHPEHKMTEECKENTQ